MLKLITLALISATVIHTANAQQQSPRRPDSQRAHQSQSNSGLKFLAGVGLSFGGDKILEASYTSGGTAQLTAGGGFEFKAGLENSLGNGYALQGTVGYHFQSPQGKDGSMTFSRVPIELIGFKEIAQNFRLGLGLRKATNPSYTTEGVLAGLGSGSGSSSLGYVLTGEYIASEKVGLALRLVNESYELDNSVTNSTKTYNGSHIGFLANFYF
jgi:hypothetical protein